MDGVLTVTDDNDDEQKILYSEIKKIGSREHLNIGTTGDISQPSGGTYKTVEIATSDSYFSIPRTKDNDSEILTFLLEINIFQTLQNLKIIEAE